VGCPEIGGSRRIAEGWSPFKDGSPKREREREREREKKKEKKRRRGRENKVRAINEGV